MKAAVFDQFGVPAEVLQVREVPKPEPAPGEVRVRMLASPINPSDVMTVRGLYGRLPKLPSSAGFEGVGVIDAVASGWLAKLRGLRPGEKVAVLNSGGGNWQEYVVLSARNVVPVGDMPDAWAATFFVNPATAWIMTREVLAVPRDAWLLQTAAGSALGLMVQRLGRHFGFRTINVVRRPEQAEELRRAGETVICTATESIETRVQEITQGQGVRYAIDAVGGATAYAVATALALRGRLLVYGTLAGEPIPLDPRALIARQSSIEGFWLSEWVKEQRVWTMLGLFRRLRKFISSGILATDVVEFPLAEIQKAAQVAESVGKGKKVLIRIST